MKNSHLTKFRIWSFLVVILLLQWINVGYTQGLAFKNFSIQSGLSQSVVNDLYQDSEGYIWIATEYGLNRFNRFEFTTYFEESGLAANNILAIFEDSNKRLLIGTENGMNYMDGDRFRRVPEMEMLNQVQINSIFEDSHGGIWIGTEGYGLFYFRDDSYINISTQNNLADNIVRKVIEMPDGQFVVATRSGLSFIRNNTVYRNLTGQNGLSESRVRDVILMNDGALWVATRDGVTMYKDGQFKYLNVSNGLIHPRVTSFTLDGSGGVWIATEGGLSHYSANRIYNYTDSNGLANNIINDILLDFERNLWVGTYGGGVDLLVGEKFTHYTVQQGLLSNMITSFEETADASIWIGTYGGGLSRLYNGTITNYTTDSGLIDSRVYTLYGTKSNTLYIGTRNGLSRFEREVMSVDAKTDDLPDMKVRTILEDAKGDLWIGTYGGGIAQFRNNRLLKIWNRENGLADDIVMKIIQGVDGRIWVATYGGINIIDGEDIQTLNIDNGLVQNSVLTIFEDNEAKIWVGTFGGISIITNEGIRNITFSEGLPNNVVYFIQQDESGMIWLGTNNGLIRYDYTVDSDILDPRRVKDTVRFKRYSVESGLTADEMNSNAVLKDTEGNFWFGTVLGVNHFRWQLDSEVTTGPPVHIEKIRLFDGEIDADVNYIFTHDQNFIGFEFIGLSFAFPNEILYEYRLRGIDQDWQMTRSRIIRYTTLPDGEFRFEVRARNPDGYWSAERATLTFRIEPPFWKSWWFILLILISVILITVFLYNYYKISKLVDLERIRIRIASDLHDDVGASLTEIALQADFLQATQKDQKISESLKQMGDMSRRIVTTMDDIVWSIDARNDTFGDLHDRMQDYANNVLFHKNIEPRFHFKGFDGNKTMSLEIRQNIYLIFKEAINNAAKHSNATKVEVNFERNDSTYKLKISDNGDGMPEKIRSGGHGLKNIRLRAQRIKADIQIENSNGLTIIITGRGI
jgi:ligand-binding sensor domain-containing protein/two-component sensor histidine kinase